MKQVWVVEDPDSDVFEEFDTEHEAVARANECIEEYRIAAYYEWPDSVEHVRVMMVVYVAKEEEAWGGNGYNYKLRRVDEPNNTKEKA